MSRNGAAANGSGGHRGRRPSGTAASCSLFKQDQPLAEVHDSRSFRWPPFTLAAVLLFLQGCFLAPSYKRPPVETPPAFKEATPGVVWKTATPKDAFPHGNWWEMFGDPQLNGLEEKVSVSNQNLKQAQAEFMEARALVKEAQAAYFPTVTATPSISRTLAPNVSTRSSTSNSNVGITNLYDLPLNAAWEPDLWGAVTFAVRTEKAAAQASAAQLQGMKLSLQAELASDYFAMEELDMETAVLNTAAAAYQKFFQLTQARFSGGVASRSDVAQAQTQLDQTLAQATDLGIARAQNEHAIAVLIGRAPSDFSLPAGRIQNEPPPIPGGLPSDLLERRPDIASAERLIVAANGQVGLARAAYFPTIALTATGGYESNTLSSWLTWPQRFWSIGASAAETLLDFGRRRAVSQQAQAAYDAQIAAYRQTVLAAFQEVEDTLAAVRLLEQEAGEQNAAMKAAEDSLNLEVLQYKAGTVSYLNVIVTQSIALNNERASAQVLGRRMTAAVTLIRAVGGGWDISQLPWPHNLESLPVASTAPVTAVGIPNPPLLPVTVSTGAYGSSIGLGASSTTNLVPALVPVAASTAALTAVSSGTAVSSATAPSPSK